MLESVFMMVFAGALVMFILAIETENVVYSAVSMLLWILTMAGQAGIYVPATSTFYQEPGLLAISFGFIIINMIWMIVLWTDYKFWKHMP